jgi:hypothetical protein
LHFFVLEKNWKIASRHRKRQKNKRKQERTVTLQGPQGNGLLKQRQQQGVRTLRNANSLKKDQTESENSKYSARIARGSPRVPKDLAALARALTGRHSGCWGIWLSKASPAAEMSCMLHRRHGKRSLAFHSQNENNSPTW